MDFTEETIENVSDSILLITNKYFIPLGEFILFRFLFTYNECLAALQIFVWCAKKDYAFFSYIIDFTVKLMEFIATLFRFILGYFLHSHTEPLYPNWICVIEIGKMDKHEKMESLFFIEQYFKLNITHDSRTNAIAIANHSVDKKCSECVDFLKHERIYEALVMAKFQQRYIVKIVNNTTKYTTESAISQCQKSSIEFLSIIYSHPDSLQVLEIKLPREMYVVGNHILSVSHVWRCIQYSSIFPNKIKFDENYKLHIIDHRALQFEIGFHNYIVLEEDDYKIMVVEH